MDLQLENIIDDSVAKVFSTMLSMPLSPAGESLPWRNANNLVAGSVGFTGVFSGILYFCMEAPFALKVAGKLLGISTEEVESGGLLVDATGELTNMISGQLKSAMCDHGMNCTLTVPSVIQGSFTVRSRPDISRMTRPFSSDNDRFQIELLIRKESV